MLVETGLYFFNGGGAVKLGFLLLFGSGLFVIFSSLSSIYFLSYFVVLKDATGGGATFVFGTGCSGISVAIEDLVTRPVRTPSEKSFPE